MFYNVLQEEKVEIPIVKEKETNAKYQLRIKEFIKKDIIAYSIIQARLDKSIRPNFRLIRKTAKELYNTIAITYMPIITIDLANTIKSLHSIKLNRTNTLKYYKDF